MLVLRPEPGAGETAARARAMGFRAVAAPLFEVRPIAWQAPPPEDFDAVLLTSPNAARHGGPALAAFTALPCYTVGESSAAAAEAAGFRNVIAGPADGAAAAASMAASGVMRAFHPCGRDHLAPGAPGLSIERRIVYCADELPSLPDEALAALADGAVALIHSPRAGASFGRLADSAGLARRTICLAAISPPAALASGSGWKRIAVADRPRDEALLEIAAKLCQTERRDGQNEAADD